MKISTEFKRFGMAAASVALALVTGTAVAKDITIAIVAANMEYPFNAAEVRGFQTQAKELGIKSIVLDPKGSVEKQGNAVDDLITRKVDGIGSILLDSVVAKTWIDRANENNIPFVSVGVQVGDPEKVPLKDVYPKLTALVTRDDVESGVIAGQMAAKFLPKDRVAQIGIVEGAAGVAAVKQRSQGFEEGLKKAGAKYKIVASQPTDWTEVKGETVCQNILTAHPDVDLFFAQYDDLGLGCSRAIRNMGAHAKVVAADGGSRRGIDAIKAGEMAGSVCSKPETMGRLSAKALYDAITNKSTVKAQLITYKQVGVTKDNLSECVPQF
ncbi:monosaccharide ABC transporter substrate-binding protein, CUT2 family [Caballeronia arationis]|jgi:ribose transport system substrate-binding protein|uniref:Monosaccharide ABC transporter substrate-binding protein, CUT2 family n=1 Tax=Caballeronia arationis TaxID=1777142 RepID=A0A7Z7I0Z6_9BURK|nr:sugar ABC transporter substrate-binding protein [Caballeronia arationis]SOE46625.1 monosaccharide ABC transporter substrate-binding protein, CUT2 family [Caballeronia arationis]